MTRHLLFLAVESLLLSALLYIVWAYVLYGFRSLNVSLSGLRFWMLMPLWIVFFILNILMTSRLGAQFTLLYHLVWIVFLFGVGIQLFRIITYISERRPKAVKKRTKE
jgi:hypothetical protein